MEKAEVLGKINEAFGIRTMEEFDDMIEKMKEMQNIKDRVVELGIQIIAEFEEKLKKKQKLKKSQILTFSKKISKNLKMKEYYQK